MSDVSVNIESRDSALSRQDVAKIHAWRVTHYNPGDAYPHQRKFEYDAAMRFQQSNIEAAEALKREIERQLDESASELLRRQITIADATVGVRASPFPTVKINLPDPIQKTALWWNDRAKTVLRKGGLKALISDKASVLIQLGMARWWDVGNLMLEGRYVGNELALIREKTGVDLEKKFGIGYSSFVYFPHLKHKPDFYEAPYDHLLFDNNVTFCAFLKAYQAISDLMHANTDPDPTAPKNILVIPCTWWLDPNLIKYDANRAWVRTVIPNIVVLGFADQVDPLQLQFALSASKARQRAYKGGDYRPIVAAGFVTLQEIDEIIGR